MVEKKSEEKKDSVSEDAIQKKEDGKIVDQKAGKGTNEEDNELSEEDRLKKEELALLVTRAQDNDEGVRKLALETIRSEIRSATSSMTSVPKPLKFLREHYLPLKSFHATLPQSETKVFLSDILSVLAMTMAEEGSRESLAFKLQGSSDAPDTWGHEYVRSLCGEIGQEYSARVELLDASADDNAKKEAVKDLMILVNQIVPFLLANNAQPEAVDLLMEVESLGMLSEFVNENTFERVCLYLQTCSSYLPEEEDTEALHVAANMYRKCNRPCQAMRIALRLRNVSMMEQIFAAADEVTQKQLAFDLARHNVVLSEIDGVEVDESLTEIMGNAKLSEFFLTLAKDLEVMEVKQPEDIYKSHLVDSRAGSSALSSNVDSARNNLASTFVNAFLNMGFGTDKLVTEEETKWIYRNRDHGMMSATASLGMILLWDVDGGLTKIDKYLYSMEEYVKAGALLAIGIVSAGVRSDVDPALALLSEHLEGSDAPEGSSTCTRSGAVLGLGIAYAGSCREDVLELLVPILADGSLSGELVAFAALSLGLIFVGSANADLASTLLQVISERVEASESVFLRDGLLVRLLPLALGLVFLGRQDACEAVVESIRAIIESVVVRGVCTTTLEACAYAGSGNVLKIQSFLSVCSEHVPEPKESEESEHEEPGTNMETDAAVQNGSETSRGNLDAGREAGSDEAGAEEKSGSAGEGSNAPSSSETASDADLRDVGLAAQQGAAVLGVAMVAMQEEIGVDMAMRMCGHLLQYGAPPVRRAVPLAYGLLSVSNPQIIIMEALSKLTHDADAEVVQSAILALGLIGAGTNNSRVAGLLRQLSSYYAKDHRQLFTVRIAQGLLHAGKGLVTLNPIHSERMLMNPVCMGGLLTVLFSAFDMKSTLLSKHHYLLYVLSLSVKPRMLFCVDEDTLEAKNVSVRVGQAVDTVGQAGRPKTITGFQTHSAPVLLSAGERAELATEEFIPSAASVLENVVLIR
eukprot:CAMPEP_0182445844 /NCGR_PEP_ID=MMETSP1172-20130603/3818_1 /TAXON_ID=708627 /ORGANISM="Timspurckia oligopyrenoides, Strain CCMP3278" /LENGTH=977 /DNA_ID=CAMNT_0024641673 /DNA_START=30 /DNA_END=2960 /DNA_ORIENTATION=-